MHITGQTVADLPAWIAKTRAMIQRKVHRLGVHHFAPFANIGHIAGGQYAGNVLFCDDGILQFPFARQAVTAGFRP